jgi:hypothetical protein
MKAVRWMAGPSLVSLQAKLRTNNEIEKEGKNVNFWKAHPRCLQTVRLGKMSRE